MTLRVEGSERRPYRVDHQDRQQWTGPIALRTCPVAPRTCPNSSSDLLKSLLAPASCSWTGLGRARGRTVSARSAVRVAYQKASGNRTRMG